jgi:hypothetical protein
MNRVLSIHMSLFLRALFGIGGFRLWGVERLSNHSPRVSERRRPVVHHRIRYCQILRAFARRPHPFNTQRPLSFSIALAGNGKSNKDRAWHRLDLPIGNLPTASRVGTRVNPNFSNTDADLGIAARKAMPHTERPTTMRMKYFGFEQAFEHIWNNADPDGLWDGDASTVAAKFGVSEDEAHATLTELCDRNLIQRVGRREYIIVSWPERDEQGEEELLS